MSRHSRERSQVLQQHVHAAQHRRGALALSVALLVLAAAPAVSRADTTVGSSLESPATITKEATADSVYWAQTLGDGASAAMPSAGTVKSVTIKGYYDPAGGGYPTIFIQVLRPQPDGSVLVVATSQPFTLPSAPGTYTFEPTGMTVQAGDFIGIATIGGSFTIGTAATGASTNDFTGHNQDMNGDTVKPGTVETNVELLAQVDLVPPTSTPPPNVGPGGKPPPPPPKKKAKPKAKPCKCKKISVKLAPTLVNKRGLPPDKHNFGVGFAWKMTCTQGKGGCTAVLKFQPPTIRAGTLPKNTGLKLNLSTLTFVCKTTCQSTTTGSFEIKMSSREQLNKLFGRTLAFTITTKCSGKTLVYRVKVFVDDFGRLHPSR
jgi:hypothetical protein